ncbi:MAG: hypothetical protein NTX98_03600 [Candidatus Doudnabacteria bacterium]|nr:hypothetical protein [Candidatus Doudnabacteria bacterium]
MKQLKLAALICLINFLFFGGFLWFENFQQKTQTQAGNLNGELSASNLVTPISPVNSSNTKKNQNPVKADKGTIPFVQSSSGSQSTNPPAAQNTNPQNNSNPAPPLPATDNRCIVVISGAKYDVTQLRQTHSGGDIFQCGTDMTQIFFSQHNQRLLDNQMAQYKIP